MSDVGKISRAAMTGIADAIRAKKDIAISLTPAQMAMEIDSIITSDSMDNAEQSTFGTVELVYEYGFTKLSHRWTGDYFKRTQGLKIIPNVDVWAVGFRHFYPDAAQKTIRLWTADGSLLAEVITATTASGGDSTIGYTGVDILFDTSPVLLKAGVTYILSGFNHSRIYNTTIANNTVHPKLTVTKGYNESGDVFPGNGVETYSGCPVCIIMGELTAAKPKLYKIQTETMDDIADEVKRITGATATLSTAQIITALQSVPVQTTE